MNDTTIKIDMKPSHPGDFIRTEILDELGLTITKAASILGVGRQALSDLVNQNSALSPEMALRIEKAFGVSMDMLLRMQAWHDTVAMREKAKIINVERYEPGCI
ncbi:MAG: HigA family addiction module antitoxin [Candidatus Nitrotoga sp.]|jgi:addiction module HigA family antidote